MTMTERTVWASLAAHPLVGLVYAAIILTQAADRPVEEISWVVPMLGAWGALILVIVGGTIASAIATGVRAEVAGEEPDFEEGDMRDKEIERLGNARAYAVASLGAGAVTVMAMLDLDSFWIGNGLFAVGLTAGLVAAASRAYAYRTGL